MSDELFFPTGAYALWCAQGEPVVDLVAGRQIFAVNFFLAWDRPSVDETGRTAWEFDKELRFSLVDDEVHITGLGELPRWVVAGFSVWTEDWRETGDTGEEELPHSEVPRVLELVWPLLYDGFDVSPLGAHSGRTWTATRRSRPVLATA